MANTLVVVAGDIKGYGATQDEDPVVPVAMLDRNSHHPTSSTKPPSSRPSWKTKKVVLGLIMGLTVAVVVAVARATLFVSVLRDSSRNAPESELLQHYPYVTITNKTPFDVRRPMKDDPWNFRLSNFSVGYLKIFAMFGCPYDFMREGLSSGRTITASSRGLCLVDEIYATLKYPVSAPPTKAFSRSSRNTSLDKDGWLALECTPYISSGTSHSIYSILMKDDDGGCCILSSHQIQKCP